ncbi:MAG: Gx transporter family protein [Candidatus Omnitrophica bacterium]|nr:Gx transporter family protein [Candidatus Omnitrophota bacterium]
MDNLSSKNFDRMPILIALASAFQITEAFIPHFIPGLRLGLANVITLIVLVNEGVLAAFCLSVIRTVLSAVFMGTFASAGFVLSFFSAVGSALIMGILYYIAQNKISIIGLSIAGAFFHNLIQLFLAYLFFINNKGIFMFLPWLGIGAIFTGVFTGIIAGRSCMELKKNKENKSGYELAYKFKTAEQGGIFYVPGNSFFYRISARAKMCIVFILLLLVLTINNLWFFLGLFFLCGFYALVLKIRRRIILKNLRKYLFLICGCFSLAFFFNSQGEALFSLAFINITRQGLNAGALCAFRVICLIFINMFLFITTRPVDISAGMIRLLSWLRFFGISAHRISSLFLASWMAVPVLRDIVVNGVREEGVKNLKDPRKLIAFFSTLIARLYYLELTGPEPA